MNGFRNILPTLFCAALIALGFSPGGLMAADVEEGTIKAEPILIFAAASTKELLDDATQTWAAANGYPPPRISYGPSATLARQVLAGAPAQLLISANAAWLDAVVAARPDLPEAQFLAYNRLAIVAPTSDPPDTPRWAKGYIETLLNKSQLAIADPVLSPLGEASYKALTKLLDRQIPAQDLIIGSDAQHIARLTQQFGLASIIYGNQARDLIGNRAIFIPPNFHPSVRYGAIVLSSERGTATEFLQWLSSPAGESLWKMYGFETIEPK